MKGNRSMQDMTEGRPISLILKFFFPLLFGMLFQQFYNLVYKSFVACCKAYGVAQEYIAIKAKREGITRQEAIEKILALREKGTL